MTNDAADITRVPDMSALRAVVVYESMYGHTREVAERVADGLRSEFAQVDVVPVMEAAVEVSADLVVVGGPTHVHGMSRPQTRQAAVDDPTRYGRGAPVEPGAAGMGLREWFDHLRQGSGPAAAFDSRAPGPAALTGRASKGIAKRLDQHGFTLVGGLQSFLVTSEPGLPRGEGDKAERWGRELATAARSSAGPRPLLTKPDVSVATS